METKKKGKLVILSGPSGCGKTTISNCLTKSPEYTRSISATTRPPRPGEKHGTDYFFITEDEFQKKIEQGEFAEYAEYHNYRYGTLIDSIDDAMLKGLIVLLVIEVNGALQIIKKFPDCNSIFILPPDIETLKERLEERQYNTPDEINERVEIALEEMEEKCHYENCVVNDDLSKAIATIKEIIQK
ncbi:MAG: guanylate kinase [Candidatus Anammoxibacter sp.]